MGELPSAQHEGAPASDSATRPPLQVLALLDDAAAGATLLELSSALARMLQRDLSVVYVESTRALVAAELPFTQVLPHGGAPWRPLHPVDVEQGFRAHATRLRELTARVALRDTLKWSLRVMRGSLSDAAAGLQAESDLLLLASSPTYEAPGFGAAQRVHRRPVVTVLGDGGEVGRRTLAVATQLAQALSGVLETTRGTAATGMFDWPGSRDTLARADVLVLPRTPLDARMLARLRCPLLLVG